MTLSFPLLLAVGLLLTAALAWAAVVSARRRTAALTAAGVAVAEWRVVTPSLENVFISLMTDHPIDTKDNA